MHDQPRRLREVQTSKNQDNTVTCHSNVMMGSFTRCDYLRDRAGYFIVSYSLNDLEQEVILCQLKGLKIIDRAKKNPLKTLAILRRY